MITPCRSLIGNLCLIKVQLWPRRPVFVSSVFKSSVFIDFISVQSGGSHLFPSLLLSLHTSLWILLLSCCLSFSRLSICKIVPNINTQREPKHRREIINSESWSFFFFPSPLDHPSCLISQYNILFSTLQFYIQEFYETRVKILN